MKKSKVIIPAMALLLFSTAASITGTVAWFSATRVFATSASTFAVNSIDGNLKANVWGRVGTEALTDAVSPTLATRNEASGYVSNGTKVRNIQTGKVSRLTHGSFNHQTTQAWIIDSELATEGFANLLTEREAYTEETNGDSTRSKWFRKSVTVSATNYEYYAAFSWEINFEYTFGGGEDKVGIFLDLDKSTIEFPKQTGGANADTTKNQTGNGFRIAMYPVTVSNAKTATESDAAAATPNSAARIFAKTADGASLSSPLTGTYTAHYVTGTAAANGIYNDADGDGTANEEGDANYMVPTPNATRVSEGIDDGDANKLATKVCDMTPTNNVGTARLVCVAWFEGTSPFVVSSAEMDDVSANLVFYGRALS